MMSEEQLAEQERLVTEAYERGFADGVAHYRRQVEQVFDDLLGRQP